MSTAEITITAAHAQAELARRSLAKSDPDYQLRGPAWQLSGAQLQELAGSQVPSPAPAKVITVKAAPKPVNKRAQVGQRAFDKAAASAPDGSRIKAGIKARAAALARFDARAAKAAA